MMLHVQRQYVAGLTPDERYVYEERLGTLEALPLPTDEQHQLAAQDVDRFRAETNPEPYLIL